jgi:hypothetical protein
LCEARRSMVEADPINGVMSESEQAIRL